MQTVQVTTRYLDGSAMRHTQYGDELLWFRQGDIVLQIGLVLCWFTSE
jgi:hypothetical protein